MEQIIRIGMDTSKHVFQLHGVNAAEEPVLRKKLRRKEMVEFFGKLPPTIVAIEACGGSHHWARELQSLGHEVKMLPPQYVKPDREFTPAGAAFRQGGNSSSLYVFSDSSRYLGLPIAVRWPWVPDG